MNGNIPVCVKKRLLAVTMLLKDGIKLFAIHVYLRSEFSADINVCVLTQD